MKKIASILSASTGYLLIAAISILLIKIVGIMQIIKALGILVLGFILLMGYALARMAHDSNDNMLTEEYYGQDEKSIRPADDIDWTEVKF